MHLDQSKLASLFLHQTVSDEFTVMYCMLRVRRERCYRPLVHVIGRNRKGSSSKDKNTQRKYCRRPSESAKSLELEHQSI